MKLKHPNQPRAGVRANARRRFATAGFTLTEIMLVVVIIGILAALVIPKIAGSSERARVTAATTDINGGIKSALGQYEVDNGFYPKSLNDLLTQPNNAKNWHGPYFDPPKLPIDPWGNQYIYYFPGKHNASSYDLLSAGADGKEGTDDDIGNWQK
ncbi:MAG TPA: type II secretion system major pseudopilin GspG [Verrucomicrobiae bacterium]